MLSLSRIPDFQPQYAGVYKCEAEIAQTAAVGYVDLAAEGASSMIKPVTDTVILDTATEAAMITDTTTSASTTTSISRGASKRFGFN